MKKEKFIYLLYSCDEWKSYSSFKLVMASTSESKIRKEIQKRVKSKDMDYGSDMEDLKEKELNYINNCLDYGFIEIVVDGEVC